MRALVLGATGHAGNAIARTLAARGWRVTAASRGHRPARWERTVVDTVHGNLEAPGQLDRWIAGHDLVVDAAAPFPLAASPRRHAATLRRVAGRTSSLLDAVERHRARLAYVSTFATLPRPVDTDHPSVRRGQPARGALLYFSVKQYIESAIIDAARSGLLSVIVNPTTFLGPWDRKPRQQCLVPHLLDDRLAITFDQAIEVIDVRDLANGLVAAVEGERWGESIPLSGHRLSFAMLTRWLRDLDDRRAPRWFVSAGCAVAPAFAIEALLSALGLGPTGLALSVQLLCDYECRIESSALRDLGVVPRPLSATLRDTVAWYRQLGYC